MNVDFIKKKIAEKFKTQTEFAESLDIKQGSVADWFSRGRIPAAKLQDVFDKLDITTEDDVETALNIPKVEVCFRAKKDIPDSEVSPEVKAKVKKFSKIFFGLKKREKSTEEILKIRKDIGENRNVDVVANIIRAHLDLTNKSPLNLQSVMYILEKFGIYFYFIPFESFSFCDSSKFKTRALTAKRENQYLVLCDSSRTWDEAFFDFIHELVHIFTGIVSLSSDEIEDFIDKVTEELIYPKEFLLREFPFIANPEVRITDKLFIDHNFYEIIDNHEFMAPRGIAKRLESMGVLKGRTKVRDWMFELEHSRFLKFNGSSISSSGKMDIDFSDTEEFENFIENYVLSDYKKYLLFYELIQGLCQNQITIRAFSEIFGLDAGEVDELRLKWRNHPVIVEPGN